MEEKTPTCNSQNSPRLYSGSEIAENAEELFACSSCSTVARSGDTCCAHCGEASFVKLSELSYNELLRVCKYSKADKLCFFAPTLLFAVFCIIALVWCLHLTKEFNLESDFFFPNGVVYFFMFCAGLPAIVFKEKAVQAILKGQFSKGKGYHEGAGFLCYLAVALLLILALFYFFVL